MAKPLSFVELGEHLKTFNCLSVFLTKISCEVNKNMEQEALGELWHIFYQVNHRHFSENPQKEKPTPAEPLFP